jgi:hypothetical protein
MIAVSDRDSSDATQGSRSLRMPNRTTPTER